MTPPFPQVSMFMILVTGIAVFFVVGIYRTFVKPDKLWHRWAGFVFLGALAMLPALTGWGPIQ